MKVKTSELEGDALEGLVAKCEGKASWIRGFTTEWEKGGPIIEREGITLCAFESQWYAFSDIATATCLRDVTEGYAGPTPLLAAMRCYVTSKLGDEVETPEELK